MDYGGSNVQKTWGGPLLPGCAPCNPSCALTRYIRADSRSRDAQHHSVTAIAYIGSVTSQPVRPSPT